MPNNTKKLHDLHPLRLLPLVLCLAMVAFFIIRGGITGIHLDKDTTPFPR